MTKTGGSARYITKKTNNLTADTIIVAIGQALDKDRKSESDIALERGVFKADRATQKTSIKGVFAGGDDVSGASSVIQAVGAGKRAADSIARYLQGADIRQTV